MDLRSSFVASDAIKTEVTYVSPSPPMTRKNEKHQHRHNSNNKSEKYALLGNDDHGTADNSDVQEKETFAWNTVLTWLLALFAVSLLPFALHYGIKKHRHRQEVSTFEDVIPTGMQSHHSFYYNHYPHRESEGKKTFYQQSHRSWFNSAKKGLERKFSPSRSKQEEKANVPHLKSVDSLNFKRVDVNRKKVEDKNPKPTSHSCVCTVHRVNKITNETQMSTWKFPLSRLHSSSSLNSVCANICAEQRTKMIELLDIDAKERTQQKLFNLPKNPSIEKIVDSFSEASPLVDTNSDYSEFDELLALMPSIEIKNPSNDDLRGKKEKLDSSLFAYNTDTSPLSEIMDALSMANGINDIPISLVSAPIIQSNGNSVSSIDSNRNTETMLLDLPFSSMIAMLEASLSTDNFSDLSPIKTKDIFSSSNPSSFFDKAEKSFHIENPTSEDKKTGLYNGKQKLFFPSGTSGSDEITIAKDLFGSLVNPQDHQNSPHPFQNISEKKANELLMPNNLLAPLPLPFEMMMDGNGFMDLAMLPLFSQPLEALNQDPSPFISKSTEKDISNKPVQNPITAAYKSTERKNNLGTQSDIKKPFLGMPIPEKNNHLAEQKILSIPLFAGDLF